MDNHANNLQFFLYPKKETDHYNRFATNKGSADFLFEIQMYIKFERSTFAFRKIYMTGIS